MPTLPDFARTIPNDVMAQEDLGKMADQWYQDQMGKLSNDWADQQNLATPSDGGTVPPPNVGVPFIPDQAAGSSALSSPPPAPEPTPSASPTAPVTTPLVDPQSDSTQQPQGGQFSPYDDTFKKYAGAFADDPEFIKIVAAGTLAESSWNANSTTGDGGHSWGLFQMHDHGAGAGMGNSRLDPDAASAVMVPRYAEGYAKFKDKLSGPALAAAVAQYAENSADPTGAGYAAAYKTLSSGNAPNVVQSAKDWLGQAAGGAKDAVGNFFSGVGGAVNAAATDPNAGPIGVTRTAVQGAANDFANSGVNQFRHDYFPNITEPGNPMNPATDPMQAAMIFGGAGPEAGGGRPLFGRGGVPGADVGRNPVPAPTAPEDLESALQASQYQAMVKQIRDLGWSDDQIAQSLRDQGVPEDQIQSVLSPPPQATVPANAGWQQQLSNLKQSDTFQSASPAEQTQMVADAQGDFQTEQNGAGSQPPTPPPSGPTEPTGPSDQPSPLQQLTSMKAPLPQGGLLSSFDQISALPISDEAKQALRQYAAVVGPDSNAAAVAAQQTSRNFDAAGGMFDPQGNLVESADQAGKIAYSQQRQAAKEALDQVMIKEGLRNGPFKTTTANGLQTTQRELDPRVQTVIDNIEQSGKIASNPLGKALLQAQSEIKGVIFPLSMFHAYTEGLNAAFSRPAGTKDFAAAFFSNSPTEAAQNTPMWLRAAKGGVTGLLDRNAPDAPGTMSGPQGALVRAGIGGVGGYGAGYVGTTVAGGTPEQAQQNALVGALAGAAGGAAAKPLISDGLWRAVQYSKVKTFEGLVNSGVDDQVAAAAVNKQFGGLNYAQMGRNRDLQNLLRLTVQAPDWNESTLRTLGSAFFGGGAGASYNRGVVARTVIGTALATEVLNFAFTGHSSLQNEPGHQAEVQLPSGTANKPVYIGIGPGNLQAYADLIDKVAADPTKALERDYTVRGQPERGPGDIPQFIYNRVGTIPQEALAGLTGGETTFAGARAPLLDELASPLGPISVGNFIEAEQNGMSPVTAAFLSGVGANPRYGSSSNARKPIGQSRQPAQRSQRAVKP